MSNQTEVLEKLLVEVKEQEMIFTAYPENQIFNKHVTKITKLVQQAIAEQQALPDREKELMAEIERLKSEHDSLLHCSKQAIKDLTEELDSLKAKHEYEVRQLAHEYKESLHHEAEKFNHRKIEIERQLEYLSRGVANNQLMQPIQMQACADCPKLKLIMGEHHE